MNVFSRKCGKKGGKTRIHGGPPRQSTVQPSVTPPPRVIFVPCRSCASMLVRFNVRFNGESYPRGPMVRGQKWESLGVSIALSVRCRYGVSWCSTLTRVGEFMCISPPPSSILVLPPSRMERTAVFALHKSGSSRWRSPKGTGIPRRVLAGCGIFHHGVSGHLGNLTNGPAGPAGFP